MIRALMHPGIEAEVLGVSGAERAALVAAVGEEQTHLIVTESEESAQRWAEDLQTLCAQPVYTLLPDRRLPSEVVAKSPEVARLRMQALTPLYRGEAAILVAPLEALLPRVTPLEVVAQAGVRLVEGAAFDMEAFVRHLEQLGYVACERVEQVGAFARRGGIVDCFPPDQKMPIRIDTFGDTIDTLRFFDPQSQRSTQRMEQLWIGPAQEVIASSQTMVQAAERLRQLLPHIEGPAAERLSAAVERLEEGLREGLETFVELLYPQAPTPVELLPKDALIWVDEPQRLRQMARRLDQQLAEQKSNQQGEDPLLEVQWRRFAPPSQVLRNGGRRRLFLSALAHHIEGFSPQIRFQLSVTPVQSFYGHADLVAEELRRLQRAGYRIFLVLSSKERGQSLLEALEDAGLPVDNPEEKRAADGKPLKLVYGTLSRGFLLPQGHMAVITEHELFVRRRHRRVRRETESERIHSLEELKPGDYVVHRAHGIGRYVGIATLDVGGIHRDYLELRYAGKDRLFVPTDQIQLIQKYVAISDQKPKLYALGGSEWARVTRRAQESVRQLAEGLLRLYAERQAMPGYAFSPDKLWQAEFEASFPYEETPDQLKSIAEVKHDMEQPHPMDRLICGDVGYGKTEVAIRAAFKAVMDSKQVAVLVPTTILADQHFHTFQERFEGYPVRIALLSRFVSEAQQRQVVAGLASGAIDIVIGTHRLLADDVHFHDLGLLIVDEEQRFGVVHKEKIKQMRKNVDLLTLSATPIPRTLNQALLGIRDLSVIQTPPKDRYPVETYVTAYNEEVIRQAIDRELQRGGQVFYLYNRVRMIQQEAERLRRLFPQARIAVAHGQMNETQLERVMLDFLNRRYDILVTTTIIENGIDLPNVNTMVVTDADRLGLAQLYQLRGRVGRSNRIAYVYFTYDPDKVLTPQAEERLAAIKEFTEQGAGFRLALRDLSIRGAGNLLGPEQHGFIAAIGFDLYQQLLMQAVAELRGEQKPALMEAAKQEQISIHLPVEAYLPTEYVGGESEKIALYQEIANVTELEQVDRLLDDLTDRFGEPPQAVLHLLKIAQLKVLAATAQVAAIERKGDVVQFHLSTDAAGKAQVSGITLVRVLERFAPRLKAHPKEPTLLLSVRNMTTTDMLEAIADVLQEMAPQEEEGADIATSMANQV